MKLHLPTKLRAAVLACMAAVATIGTTIATGTIAGGALVAALATTSQVMAADITINADTPEADRTWTLTEASDNTHANDVTTVVGPDVNLTITRTNNTNTPPENSVYELGTISVTDGGAVTVNVFISNNAASTTVTRKEKNINLDVDISLSGGSTLKSNDSSFYLNGTLSVSGENTFSADPCKSYDLAKIVGATGDGTDTLNIQAWNNSQWANANSMVRILDNTGAYNGTLNVSSLASPTFNIYGETNSFQNAVLNLSGKNVRLLVGTETLNVKTLKGSGSIDLLGISTNYYDQTVVTPPSAVTVVIADGAGQTFSGSTAAKVTLQLQSGTLTLDSATIAGSLTNSGTLTINGSSGVAGSLTNASGATLNLGGSASVAGVNNSGALTLTGSSKVGSIANSGTVNFTGDVVLSTYDITGVGTISFAGVTSATVDYAAAKQLDADVQDGQLTATFLIMDSDALSGVDISTLGTGFSYVDGQLIYTAAPVAVNGWDANWSVAGLQGAPTSTVEITDLDGNLGLAANGNDSGTDNHGDQYKLNDTTGGSGFGATLVDGGSGGADRVIVGGYYISNMYNFPGSYSGNTWIAIEGGTWGTIVGGNYANNGSNGSACNFTGNSHLLMSSGTVNNLIGATMRNGRGDTNNSNYTGAVSFTGNTYVSVKGGDVKGFVLGAGTTAFEQGENAFSGTTNVWIYTPLTTPDTSVETVQLDSGVTAGLNSQYAAVAGGGATSGGGTLRVTGTTNVTVDLSGYTGAATTFGKYIVGGSLGYKGSAVMSGDTYVTVNGAAGVTFDKAIVGGSMEVGSSVTQSGSTHVTINAAGGETFSGIIVGGNMKNSGNSLDVRQTDCVANLTINGTGATFSGAVTGGLYVAGQNLYNVSYVGSSNLVINGGTFNGVVTAGANTQNWSPVQLNGLSYLEVNAGTFNGVVVGSAYKRGTGASSQITNVSTDPNALLNLNGGTYNKDIVGGMYVADASDTRNWSLNGSLTVNLGADAVVQSTATVYGGSYVNKVAGSSTLTQADVYVTLGQGSEIYGNVYAAGSGTTSDGAVTTKSTTVTIEEGAVLGSEGAGITISGGYKDTGTNVSVTGAKTLALDGTSTNLHTLLANATLANFDTVKVSQAGSAAELTDGMITAGIATKTGAGTLIISGDKTASLTNGLTISEGALSVADTTNLTGLTFGENTTLELSKSDSLILSGALTLASGFSLDLSGLGEMTTIDQYTLVSFGSMTGLTADAIGGLDTLQLGAGLLSRLEVVDGNKLVLTVYSNAANRYWVDGGDGIWSASDEDNFADAPDGSPGPDSAFSSDNRDNVIFTASASPRFADGSTITAGLLTLQDGVEVSLNVNDGEAASFSALGVSLGTGSSLSKVGEGTLTLSKNLLQAATAFELKNGTVKLSDLSGETSLNVNSATGTTLSLGFTADTANTLAFGSGNTLAGTTAITSGYVSMDKVATLDVASGATVNLTNYTNTTAMSLTGSGTVLITVSGDDAANNITYVTPDADTGVAGWTGTVVLSGAGQLYLFSGTSSFGNSNSTIKFNGLIGYCGKAAGYTAEIASKVVFENPAGTGTTYAWHWNDAHDRVTLKFTNTVSGSGNIFVDTSARDAGNNLLFTGDVSDYDGTIYMKPGKNPTQYSATDTTQSRNTIAFTGNSNIQANIEANGGSGRSVWVQITNDTKDVEFSGTLSETATSGTKDSIVLHKGGASALTITEANAHSGGTFVDAGTLITNNASALGTGAVTVATSATLQVGTGQDGSVGSLTLGGNVSFADSSTLALTSLSTTTAALDITGTLTLGSGLTLDLSNLNPADPLTGEYLIATTGGITLPADTDWEAIFTSITGLGTYQCSIWQDGNSLKLGLYSEADALVWNTENSVWKVGEPFGKVGSLIINFADGKDVTFGELPQGMTSETVTIEGALTVGDMVVSAGADGTYVFTPGTDADGITSLGSLAVNSGTAEFAAGALDLTAETLATVADAATLVLHDAANNLNITMEGASTLQMAAGKDAGSTAVINGNADSTLIIGSENAQVNWDSANVTGLGSVTIADGATVTAVGSGGAISATGNTGAVSLGAGSTLKLGGSNQGFASINTGTSGTVVVTTASEFASGKFIYGSGTIEIAVGDGQSLTSAQLVQKAIANANEVNSQAAPGRFTGTYMVTSGQFALTTQNAGRVSNGLTGDEVPKVVVKEAGQLYVEYDDTWNLHVTLSEAVASGSSYAAGLAFGGTASRLQGSLTMADGTGIDVQSGAVSLESTIQATGDVYITTASGSETTLSGTVEGLGNDSSITKNGTGTLKIANAVSNTTVKVDAGVLQLATADALAAAGVNLSASGAQLTVADTATTYTIGSLSGVSGSTLATGHYAVTGTGNFGGTVTGGTEITVRAGAEQGFGSATFGDDVTIISEAGSTVKDLTLGSGVTLAAQTASDGTVGVTTLSGATTLNGGALQFSLGDGQDGTTVLSQLAVAGGGTLTVAANSQIILTPDGMTIAQGDHLLISGFAGGAEDLLKLSLNYTNEGRTQYTLNLDGTNLYLNVNGEAASLLWNGGESGAWDVATTQNWLNEGSQDVFYTDDHVTFGTLTGADGNTIETSRVAIDAGGVISGALTVIGDTDYVFEGGSISSTAGSGAGLTVGTEDAAFTGTLTIKNANSWDGDTVINSGTVIAQNEEALGDATHEVVINQGGTLQVGVDSLSAVAVLNGGTVQSSLVGGGSVPLSIVTLKLNEAGGTLKGDNPDVPEGTTAAPLTATIRAAHEAASLTIDGLVYLSTVDGVTVGGPITVHEASQLDVASGATLSAASIAGDGTLGVTGSLRYSGSELSVANVTVQGGNMFAAEGGTTATGQVRVYQGGAFIGTWTVNNLASGSNLTVGAIAGGENTGSLTLTGAVEGAIVTVGNGSSFTAQQAGTFTSVMDCGMVSGTATITLADGTSVGQLSLAATGDKTLNSTLGDGQGTLTVTGDAILVNTDVNVGTLIFNGRTGVQMIGGTTANTVQANGILQVKDATIDELLISEMGQVRVNADASASKVGTVTISGGLLDMYDADLSGVDDGTKAAITMQAGSLGSAGAFTGTVTVDDATGEALAMGGLTGQATLVLKNVITSGDSKTTITELAGATLGDGSSITLSSAMADGTYTLLESSGAVSVAQDATVTFVTYDVLTSLRDYFADETNTDPYSLTISNADLTGLNGGVSFDAALGILGYTGSFTANGTLEITQTPPADPDSIYYADQNNTGDGAAWAGNGPDVYTSSDQYSAVVINQNTTIDLTQATVPADRPGLGLQLPNLIGDATLTVNGDNATAASDADRDLVTILPDAAAGETFVYGGAIDLNGTDLQLAAKDSDSGELAPDLTYEVKDTFTADADSQLILTSGNLVLSGTGNELLGGVSVTENSSLVLNGSTSIGGEVTGSGSVEPDVEIAGGNTVSLVGGTSLQGVQIAGGTGSVLQVTGDASIDTDSSTSGAILAIDKGQTLSIEDAGGTGSLEFAGLTQTTTGDGSAALKGGEDAVLALNVAKGEAYTYDGKLTADDMADSYNGTIIIKGEGTQAFTQDASATSFDVQGGNLVLTNGVGAVKDLSVAGDGGTAGSTTVILASQNVDGTLTNDSLAISDTLNLGQDSTFNVVFNLTQDVLNGTGLITAGSAIYDGGSVTLNVLGMSSDVDLTGGGVLEAVVVDSANTTGTDVTLANADDALLQKYFGNTAHLEVKADGKLVLVGTKVDGNTAHFHQSVAQTKNGTAGAQLLDELYGALNPQVNAPDSDAAHVLDALEQMILGGGAAGADRTMAAVSGASATVMGSAFAGDLQRQMMAIRNRTTTMGVDDSVVNQDMPYFNAWINAEGAYTEMKADGTLPGYELSSWGGTVGFDVDVNPHLTCGLALTAMYGDLTAKSADSAEGDLNTYYLTAFARYAPSAWVHTFVVSFGIADAELNRTVSYGGGSYRTSGDTDGFGFGLMYEVGYTIPMNEEGTTAIQPIVNVTYAHSSIGGYTESGSDLAIRYGDQDMDVFTIGVGLRAQTVIGENLYNRASLLEGRVLAKFDLGDRSSSTDTAFANYGLSRSAGVESAEVGAVGLEVGLGLTVPLGQDSGSIFVDASLELRSEYTGANATVGYRVNF